MASQDFLEDGNRSQPGRGPADPQPIVPGERA